MNNTPELNGNLSEIYDHLAFVLSGLYDDYTIYQSGWEYLEEGNTNFTYLYVDREKKQVLTNKTEYADYSDAGAHIREMKSGDSVKYMIVNPRLKDFETNMNLTASGEWDMVRSYESSRDSENILAVSVDTSYPIQDQFYEGSANYNQNIPFLRWALFLFIAGGILFLVSAVWLAVTAGKRPGDEELHLTVFDHWKTEISAALVIGLWVFVTCTVIAADTTFGSFSDVSTAAEYYGTDTIPVVYSTLFTTAINMADLAGLFFLRAVYVPLLFCRICESCPKDQGKDPLERKPALYADIRDWTGMGVPGRLPCGVQQRYWGSCSSSGWRSCSGILRLYCWHLWQIWQLYG